MKKSLEQLSGVSISITESTMCIKILIGFGRSPVDCFVRFNSEFTRFLDIDVKTTSDLVQIKEIVLHSIETQKLNFLIREVRALQLK